MGRRTCTIRGGTAVATRSPLRIKDIADDRKPRREIEAKDGERVVETFADRRGSRGMLSLELTCETFEQSPQAPQRRAAQQALATSREAQTPRDRAAAPVG